MRARLLTTLLLGAFLFSSRLPAQSTFATVTGTVTDSTGAVVPGTIITATHVATNLTSSAQANSAGVYTLANLREGAYKLKATATGFKEIVIDDIKLAARDIRRVDITLQVGEVQQSVEVTATAGVIETETGRVSDLRTSTELNSYAANATSRSLWRYFSLSPMFVNNGSAPSFAGSRNDQYQVSFDGSSVSNGMGGTLGGNIMDYSDWVREVHTDFVNSSAENGQLVNISVVAKSGENDFHGSAFDIYGTPVFRARNPFASERATGVSHIPGVSAGGPIYIPKVYDGRNRTFWYVAGERNTGGATGVSRNSTVPLESWRNGQFSNPIRNPFTGEVYQDGKIPDQWISPVSKKLQDIYYPVPNYGSTTVLQSSNYRINMAQPFPTQNNLMTRVDQRIGNGDYVYATFMMNQLYVGSFENNLPVFGPRNQLRKQKMLNLTWSHTFRPNLLNELRFGHGGDTNDVRSNMDGANLVKTLGLQGLAPDLPSLAGTFNLSFSGIGLTSTSGVSRSLYAPRSETLQDQVSWFHGRHSFHIGGLFGRAFPRELSADSYLFGYANFSNKFSAVPNVSGTGSPYADFLFGVPTTTQRSFSPLLVQRRRTWEDMYVQDTWRASPKLTIDLGLRYEYHPAWSEASGLMAAFDPATASIVVPNGSLSKVSPLLPKSFNVVEASAAGYPTNLIATDKNNFAPRFGVAWRPLGNQTVFRGAFGIYYDATPQQVSMGGQPFMIQESSYTNPGPGNPGAVAFPQLLPVSGSNTTQGVSLPSGYNPHMKIPYTEQWNATVEHEYKDFGFRLTYAGTAAHQMVYSRDINSPVPNGELYINKPRPFTQYVTGIGYNDNGANHIYHGVSVAITRRMKNGLMFESSYTLARDIGDDPSSIENPFNRVRDRGVEQIIPTHRWVTSFIYEMPFGRGRKWMAHVPRAIDAALGGWQLASNIYIQTGQFLTPSITLSDPVGISAVTSATRKNVTLRPDELSDPNNGPKTVNKWFDTSAFAAPAIGSFGSSARGVIIGPGENVFHATLQKYFRFSENPRAPRLRLDLYAANVFNHPNWNNPNTNVTSPDSAGVISDTGGVNRSTLGDTALDRTMRVGLRLEW